MIALEAPTRVGKVTQFSYRPTNKVMAATSGSAVGAAISTVVSWAIRACDTAIEGESTGALTPPSMAKAVSWQVRKETHTPHCLETMECARRSTQLDGVDAGSSLP